MQSNSWLTTIQTLCYINNLLIPVYRTNKKIELTELLEKQKQLNLI